MTGSLLWALASTAGAGVNDLLFKGFISRSPALGIYFAGIGIVWALILVATKGTAVATPDANTLAWGLLAGTFSVSANIALVRALAHLDATVGSTIYRLNFVAVMFLAVPVLGEPITSPKLWGLLAAALAVIFFARDGSKSTRVLPKIGLILAVAASLTRAGMGITYKLALQHGVGSDGFVFAQALCWLVGGILWAALSERHLRLDRRTVLFAAASGVLVVEIVVTLTRALESGQAGVVVPITQLSFLCTTILSALFLRERLGSTRILALGCGVLAVLVLAQA